MAPTRHVMLPRSSPRLEAEETGPTKKTFSPPIILLTPLPAAPIRRDPFGNRMERIWKGI